MVATLHFQILSRMSVGEGKNMEEFSDGEQTIRSRGLSVFVEGADGEEVEIKPNSELAGWVSVLGSHESLEEAVNAAKRSKI